MSKLNKGLKFIAMYGMTYSKDEVSDENNLSVMPYGM